MPEQKIVCKLLFAQAPSAREPPIWSLLLLPPPSTGCLYCCCPAISLPRELWLLSCSSWKANILKTSPSTTASSRSHATGIASIVPSNCSPVCRKQCGCSFLRQKQE